MGKIERNESLYIMVNTNKSQKEKYRSLLQVRRREKSENVAYTHLKRYNLFLTGITSFGKKRIQQKEYSGLKSKSVERKRKKTLWFAAHAQSSDPQRSILDGSSKRSK